MHVIHSFKSPMAHKTLWHPMTNIGAINSKHKKTYGVTKKSWIAMKIYDTLLPNGMPCHITWKTELLLITKDKIWMIVSIF